MKTKKPLTNAQRFAFFKACAAACESAGIFGSKNREEYRKKVMREECQKDHLADLNRTDDFDRCMTRFARDAGDYLAAAKFAAGSSYRFAVLIRICCQQIMQLKGFQDGSDAAKNYLAGVLDQARIKHGDTDGFWLDVSPSDLEAVFFMLDTHRRRLLDPIDGMDSLRGFDPQIVYKKTQFGIEIKFDRSYYDSYNSLTVFVRSA